MRGKIKIKVDLKDQDYSIFIGRRLFQGTCQELIESIEDRNVVMVTDAMVDGLYGDAFFKMIVEHAGGAYRYAFPSGEPSKNMTELSRLLSFMAQKDLDRHSLLAILGGGVPGDMGGLAAAVFKRGISYIQVPTTLIAQIDSSVGGKTAVNLPEGKNLVGSFHQPEGVFIDPDYLMTLERKDWLSGLGELVKYGVLISESFLEKVESLPSFPWNRLPETFPEIIADCCRYKAKITEKDAHEKGLRMLLNLGHTIGHAIEAVQGYGACTHGEAVAFGLCGALEIARLRNKISPTVINRLRALMKKFGFSENCPELNAEEILKFMVRDKKRKRGQCVMVIPGAVGRVSIVEDIEIKEIKQAIDCIIG